MSGRGVVVVLQDIGGLITDLNIHSTATDNSCVIYANVLCFNLVFVFFVTIFHPAQRDSSGKTSKKDSFTDLKKNYRSLFAFSPLKG